MSGEHRSGQPPHIAARNSEIVEARNKGESWAIIAERWGISQGSAQRGAKDHMRRAEWISKNPGLSGLSVRSAYALFNTGVTDKIAVSALTREQLLDTPNLGLVSVDEIEEWLVAAGLTFAAPLDEPNP